MSSNPKNKSDPQSPLLQELRDICRLDNSSRPIPDCGAAATQQINFLKSILSTIPSPVFIKDAEGRYLGLNRAYEELTGLKSKDLVGKKPSEVSSLTLGDIYEESDREVLDCLEPRVYQSRINNSKGDLRDIEVNKTVFRDEHGRLAGIVGVMVDITEKLQAERSLRQAKNSLEEQVNERSRKLEEANRALKRDIEQRQAAEKARKQSETRFMTLFESMDLGVVYHSPSGAVLEVNPAAQKMLGLSLQQLKGLSPRDPRWRMIKEDGTPFADHGHLINMALASGKPVPPVVVGVLNPKLEEYRWLRISAQPCMSREGNSPYEAFATFEDITELKLQAEQLKRDRDFTQVVLDTVAAIVVVMDHEGGIVRLNREGQEISGYGPGELLGCRVWDHLIPPGQRQGVEQAFELLVKGGPSSHHEIDLLCKDGSTRMVSWASTVLRDDEGNLQYVIGTGLDVTERRQAEDFVALASKVFENAIEGVTVTDKKGNIEFVNRAFTIITGYRAEEVVGGNPRMLKSDRHDEDFYNDMWKSLMDNGEWHGEIWNRRKSGEAYPEWLAITAVKDAQGEILRYVAVFNDISEIKHSQEQVEFYSNHDALTGLPNRDMFKTRLESALVHARGNRKELAVLAVDIDDFKHYNDTLGHVAGDQILQLVGERLKSTLGPEAAITRMGGDQFFALAEESGEASQVAQLAQSILEAIGQGFMVQDRELHLSVGIGIAMCNGFSCDPESLIINADLAMHQAKVQGRNSYSFYTSELNEQVLRRLELETDLRKALEREEFRVLYQPKVELESGRVVGMEALIRWEKPDGSMVSPVDFIPLAEQTGLILPIGQWVLQKACHQTQIWREAYNLDLKVAVNLSVNQFRDLNLHLVVEDSLRSSGLPASALELELTESTLMQDTETAMATMENITKLGVTFALDDFGTGYSSMSYLQKLPISSLKVDKSFVDNTPDDTGSATIVATIIALAHAIRVKSVAEGVETWEQLFFLRGLSCSEMQGYLFSQPLSAAQFGDLLREGRRLTRVGKDA